MAASVNTIDPAGANNKVTYTANADGVEFNALSIAYIDPAAASQALAVTFDGLQIKVFLATDSGSSITSTANAVRAAICGTKASNTLTATGNTNVSDGDTVRIGGTTYRFKSVTAQANDIFIGASADASLGSLVKVLNGTATIAASGADAFTGTLNGHALVSAGAVTSHATIISARDAGTPFNGIITTTPVAVGTWAFAEVTLGGAAATTIGADSIDTGINVVTGAGSNNPRRTMHLLTSANFAANDGTGTCAAVAAAFFTGSTLEPTTGYADVPTAQLSGWVFLGTTTTGKVTMPAPQNTHNAQTDVWQAYHSSQRPTISLQSAPSAAALLIATKLFMAQAQRKGVPFLILSWFDPALWAR